jgi:lantibiotic biosynthesis dehydratase-like protein
VDWRSVHVSYYDDRKDGLIVEAVQPVLRHIAREVPAAYFVRHWRLGPHLRLNVHTDATTFERTVLPAVHEVVGGYLARHPSTVVLDERRLAPLHAALAAAEQDSGPRSPWRADNSIHEAPYDDRSATAGGPRAAALLADFYVATTDIAFAMAEHVVDGGQRLAPCFDLLVATAHTFCQGGLGNGFISFRSHAEAFLVGTGSESRRAAWDRGFTERAERLCARVDDVVATLDGPTERVPLVRDWVAALRPVHRRCEELMSAGAIAFDDLPLPEDGGPSPFHRALLRGPAYTDRVRDSVWFRCYRMVLNYLYLHLTRHGVPPVDRYMLCHLAANAVEERMGVTAVDIVSGAVAAS